MRINNFINQSRLSSGMIQDVFIIGATGKVGKRLVQQFIEKQDTNAQIHENPTRIIGLASSTHFIYDFGPDLTGISQEKAYNFSQNRNYRGATAYTDLTNIIESVNTDYPHEESSLVFIDVTAAKEDMLKFHTDIIRHTPYNIVTANKNPIALSDYATFQELTENPQRYGYRCSVMAGSEAVPYLQDLRDLNDKLISIQGCFSGTLGFICSELEKNKKLSEIVKDAYNRGYTEPHPRDDLNGLDVSQKLVILARTAGYPINMENVNVEPLLPSDYLQEENVDLFLRSLAKLDNPFAKDMNVLLLNGFVPRYIAAMGFEDFTPKLDVKLMNVPKQSPLGSLEGTLNKIVIVSEAYDVGYSIEARGAGLDVTARNIRRDLLHLLKERRIRN